jgi:hypothetical protein
LQSDLQAYLSLWNLAIPDDLVDLHAWDYSRFSRGERFVYEPIPRAEFDEVLAQVERWGLDEFLTDRSFDNLTYHATK